MKGKIKSFFEIIVGISSIIACLAAVVVVPEVRSLAQLANNIIESAIPTPITLPSTNSAPVETPTEIPAILPFSTELFFSPTPIPTNIPTTLFSENFENGEAQNFTPRIGFWKVALDETGNSVYDIDNMSENRYASTSFGSVSWKDYTVSYRVRLLEYSGQKAQASLYFRWDTNTSYEQDLIFSNYVQYIGFWSGDTRTWTKIAESNFDLNAGIWYSAKIDIYGTEITTYINNERINDVQDFNQDNGQLMLSVGNNTHAQFDDILVTVR